MKSDAGPIVDPPPAAVRPGRQAGPVQPARRERPLYDAASFQPAESVGYLMKLLTTSLQTHVERAMEPHGLTAGQWHPVYMLATGRAGTAADLARLMQVDNGAVTRMLDRLEAKGLVARDRRSDDRRIVRLALTDAGRDVAAQVPAVLCRVLNHHLRGFAPQELALLERLLRRMLANGTGVEP